MKPPLLSFITPFSENGRSSLAASWRETGFIEKTTLILLCLIPLGIVFGRAIAEISQSLIALIYLLQLLLQPSIRTAMPRITLLGILLWLVMVAAVSPQASISWQESLYHSAIWIRYPLLFGATITLLSRRPELFAFIGIIIAPLLTFMCMDGLIQRFTGMSVTGNNLAELGGRMTGPLSTPNIGAVAFSFLAVLLTWQLPHLLGKKPSASILFYAILSLLVFLTVLLSGERTVTVMLFVSVGIGALILFSLRPTLRLWIAGIVLLLAALMLVAIFLSPYLLARAELLKEHLRYFPDSPYGELVHAVMVMWQDNPFFGVGIRNFRLVCPELLQQSILSYCNLHAHNYYLELLSEGGLISFALFTAMVGFASWQLWRFYRDNRQTSFMPGALVPATMWLIFSFFPLMAMQSLFSSWRGALLWYGFGLVMAGIAAYSRMGATNER